MLNRNKRSSNRRNSIPTHPETLETRVLLAADPIISEFLASNDTNLQDGARDTPDWIEIYNQGDETADLTGWYLTDDASDLTKWQFPQATLEADSYLVVFASGKNEPDRRDNLHTNFKLSPKGEYLALVQPDGQTLATDLSPAYPEQLADISYGIPMGETEVKLVSADTPAQLLVPTDESLGTAWTTPGFVIDENWITELEGQPVTSAVGYEDNSGFAQAIGTDIEAVMKNQNASVYLRTPFQVEDPSALDELFLQTKFDDGYIAYLNGTIIDVQNGPFFRAFDSTALIERPNAEALVADQLNLEQFRNLLVPGENVLGIQGLNLSAGDSDFLLAPEIVTTVQTITPDEFGYFVTPTPEAINQATFDLGPRISQVEHTPDQPGIGDPLVVTAKVERTLNPVGQVQLIYRSMYDEEVTLSMSDNGSGGDLIAGDGIFTATIPAGVSEGGEMTRYYVSAQDELQNTMREPRITDDSGTDRSPEYFGTMVSDPSVSSELPIFHWFSENAARARQRSGARVSVYYAGEFYDNVFARKRGRATNGNSQKFNFSEDHPFYVNEVLGRVVEFNMNAQGQDPTYVRQPLAYNSYTWAGNESSESFFMLMRRNGDSDRVGIFIEQVNEDFLERNGLDRDGALYKFVQRGNLEPVFSDITTGIEKKTRLDEGMDDLKVIVDGLSDPDRAVKSQTVFDHFNLAQLMNFLAVRSITMDADDVRKNFYGFRDTNGTGQWSIFPWDKDWTFGVTGDGGQFLTDPYFADEAHRKDNALQWNRLYDAVFNDEVLSEMYLRRLRTVMDDFLQPPGTDPADGFFENKVDEIFAPADPHISPNPNSIKSFLPARRNTLYNEHGIDLLGDGQALIDIIPESATVRYFVPTDNTLGATWTGRDAPANDDQWQTGPMGIGFENAPADYEQLIKTRVKPAEACGTCTSIFVRIPFSVDDAAAIEKMSLRMKYDDGFVAYINGVEVTRSNSRDQDPEFDSRGIGRRDRDAVEFENFNISAMLPEMQLGAENVLALQVMNSSSTNNDMLMSLALVEGVVPDPNAVPIPHAQVGNPVVSIERFEHDPASGNQDEEFIELKNDNDTAVDISGWRLTGGIEHEFPAGTVIPSNRSMFVSPSVQAFLARSESPRAGESLIVQGNYAGHLSNFGETVNLLTADGQQMSTFTTPLSPTDPQMYLRVSELHFNPEGSDDTTEFLELINISEGEAAQDIDLSGVTLANGPSQPFVIPAGTVLSSGEFLVLARDRDALLAANPQLPPAKVIGGIVGSFSNSGERIKLNDAQGGTILDFTYNDNSLWPQASDGVGASLVAIAPANTPTGDFDKSYHWRNSVEFGGTPGEAAADPIPVVVNEVLSNSEGPGSLDLIELFNTSSETIAIGGWYLSDSGSNLLQYQIPANTELAPGQYLTLDENQFNAGGRGFALNGDEGDNVWLVVATAEGSVESFVDDIHFGASRPNESLGRSPNGTGRLTPMNSASFAGVNSSPRRSEVILSEVHYHPAEPSAAALEILPNLTASDLEFIELSNSGAEAVDLTGWQIRGGVDFEFDANSTIAPGQSIVVLRFNPAKERNQQRLAAWKAEYGVQDDVALFGGYSGSLDNSQQIVRLESAGPPSESVVRHYVEEEVVYDDRSAWPTSADGDGDSLSRNAATSLGNDPTSWSASAPTPGSFETAETDLNGDGIVSVADIDFACEAINGNVPSFDLNGDGVVTVDDAWFFVTQSLGTSIGDSNLDGVFDSGDLVTIFQGGQYEDAIVGNSSWATGDWNCNGEFDTSDLVAAFQAGGYVSAAVAIGPQTFGLNQVAAAVPNDDAGSNENADPDDAASNRADEAEGANDRSIQPLPPRMLERTFDMATRSDLDAQAVDRVLTDIELE